MPYAIQQTAIHSVLLKPPTFICAIRIFLINVCSHYLVLGYNRLPIMFLMHSTIRPIKYAPATLGLCAAYHFA